MTLANHRHRFITSETQRVGSQHPPVFFKLLPRDIGLMRIADVDAAFFGRQSTARSFHNSPFAHNLARLAAVHVGSRVDRVLQHRSNERQRRQLPSDGGFPMATPIHRQSHLVGDEPQVRLVRTPGLTVFCKHQLNRRPDPIAGSYR